MADLSPAQIQAQYIDSLTPKKPGWSLPSFGLIALAVGGAAFTLWHFTKDSDGDDEGEE